ARTDPDVPKHRGMTYFVIDMHAPGVDVRPLRQMTGEAEFNEVFMTDVRIPDGERLGDVGQGWAVALTTLMNERVSIGGNVAPGRGRVRGARGPVVVPAGPGQLDRGRHVRGDAQHPRRAGARPARRAEGRPRPPVEGRAEERVGAPLLPRSERCPPAGGRRE